jgi:hypothetical protein
VALRPAVPRSKPAGAQASLVTGRASPQFVSPEQLIAAFEHQVGLAAYNRKPELSARELRACCCRWFLKERTS